MQVGDVSIPGMEPLPNEHCCLRGPQVCVSGLMRVIPAMKSNLAQINLRLSYAISTLTDTDKVAELLQKELETVAADKDTTTGSLIEVAILAGGIPASATTFS